MQFIELFTHASAENFLNSHQLTAALAGTLTVNLLGGFIPDIGQTFAILTADDFDGTFVSEVLPSVPGLMFDVIYNPNSVVLTVSPAFTADFDEDDDVDSDDLTQRHGGFGENALSDGDSDGDDFLAWQRQLGSVPAVAATAVVPEPATFLLFIAASAGFRELRAKSVKNSLTSETRRQSTVFWQT